MRNRLGRPALMSSVILLGGAIGVESASATALSGVPASCPVTVAPEPTFTPPAPYPAEAPYGMFWHGSERLWTMRRPGGTWRGVPPDRGYRRGYRDKVFWWRPGYSGRTEPQPALSVTARRLDGEAPMVSLSHATNAHHVDFGGWVMLTAIDIPTTGCWEITARYSGDALTFVVWVVP